MPATTSTGPQVGDKIAQMTDRWVAQSLRVAVGRDMARDVVERGYARHIMYAPFHLPSAVQHEDAIIRGGEHVHGNHEIPLHYTEAEVAKAAKLSTRYAICEV